jgi:general secretion pathway protein J
MTSAAPARTRNRPGESGFTLIEVLAALALASLILVSLNLAMNAITRGVSKTRDSLGTQSALAAAAGIFAQDVARIAKIRRGETDGQGYLFEGSARQMTYPLSEREGLTTGGLYLVRLRVTSDKGSAKLVRERAPIPAGEEPDLSPTWGDAVVLLEGPFDIAFAYRAQRSGARAWVDGWSGAEAMPEQVRLTISGAGTDRLRIPVLVQSLQVNAEVECVAPGSCGEADGKAAPQ